MGHRVDVLVIGGGIAGAMAATQARWAGLQVLLVRRSLGATAVSSGAIHFRGVERWMTRVLGNVRAAQATIDDAAAEFMALAEASNLAMRRQRNEDILLVNPYGTITRTAVCAETMAAGDLQKLSGASVLFAGVCGYPDFDAAHIAKSIAAIMESRCGPGNFKSGAVQVEFPRVKRMGNLNSFDLAQILDDERSAFEFANRIAHAADLSQYTHVALPPVLGLKDSRRTVSQIQHVLGIPCFETLALPPSVPGFRLQNALDSALERSRITVIHARVTGFAVRDHHVSRVQAKDKDATYEWYPKVVILATGKFVGGGIERSNRLRETVFDLPVFVAGRYEPGTTMQHLVADRFTAHQPIFGAGLGLDASSRPTRADGQVAYRNLFAAGAVNSGVDSTRGNGGLGLCVVSGSVVGKHAAQFVHEETSQNA